MNGPFTNVSSNQYTTHQIHLEISWSHDQSSALMKVLMKVSYYFEPIQMTPRTLEYKPDRLSPCVVGRRIASHLRGEFRRAAQEKDRVDGGAQGRCASNRPGVHVEDAGGRTHGPGQ